MGNISVVCVSYYCSEHGDESNVLVPPRTKAGGTVFRAESSPSDGSEEGAGGAGAGAGGGGEELEGSWFSVGVFKELVSVQWRLGARLPRALRMRAHHSHLRWTSVRFTFRRDQIIGNIL